MTAQQLFAHALPTLHKAAITLGILALAWVFFEPSPTVTVTITVAPVCDSVEPSTEDCGDLGWWVPAYAEPWPDHDVIDTAPPQLVALDPAVFWTAP